MAFLARREPARRRATRMHGWNNLRPMSPWSVTFDRESAYGNSTLVALPRRVARANIKGAEANIPVEDVSCPPFKRSLSDMDPKELFPSWFEALSHSARSSWRDQKSWLYDETSTFAYYNGFFNTLIVPTLLLSHPLFYAGGPAALNYGGLGTTIGHEITHIFDVYLKMSKENSNLEPGFKEEFMKRIECLRASGRAPNDALWTTTVENFATEIHVQLHVL
ncbi:hypothetical protein HPB49_015989 [Dermacentor silvarum]|uniref:Uncharacterized protein n=1 Tax=Dermacentor silvarum TaxID=543639 RepID=A0ACB8C4J0_DERSI|nr:hypothetical protein HPB49_015989 [Dermacentor silvarum]